MPRTISLCHVYQTEEDSARTLNCHPIVISLLIFKQERLISTRIECVGVQIMVQEMELETEARNESLPSVSLGVILIIEDDPRMQKVLRRIFTEEHYTAVVAGDGQTGLNVFRREQPLAVILDLILPNISGRELCQTFKGLSAETPIVVLSAITDVADKVLLLELGADDYVTKPFSPRELTARVQAAIRRQRKPAPPAIFRFADCEVDFKKMTVRRDRKTYRPDGSRVQAPQVLSLKMPSACSPAMSC